MPTTKSAIIPIKRPVIANPRPEYKSGFLLILPKLTAPKIMAIIARNIPIRAIIIVGPKSNIIRLKNPIISEAIPIPSIVFMPPELEMFDLLVLLASCADLSWNTSFSPFL